MMMVVVIITMMMMVIMMTMLMSMLMMIMTMMVMTSWDAGSHKEKLSYLSFTDRHTARLTVFRREHGLSLTSLDVG
jgi:hypothetical protein